MIDFQPILQAAEARAGGTAALHDLGPCDLGEDKGGFGAYLAGWPGAEMVGLWDDLAKRFSHLGGNSAPYFLRMAGKDTFLLTNDVARALQHWGVPLGRRRQAAREQGRPATGPGGLQRLDRGNGPPAVPAFHDPGALGRLISRSGSGSNMGRRADICPEIYSIYSTTSPCFSQHKIISWR